MFPEVLERRAAELIDLCRAAGLTLAVAESCTGGLLAGVITAIPGASDVFDRGFVTYSNAAKRECLGVPLSILESCGAVSPETAEAMAAGVLACSAASLAASVTGIAGPGGGSPGKPVGLVYFGIGRKSVQIRTLEMRYGDMGRGAVRLAAAATAIELLLDAAR
ncbi:MAG TPA: nicotinamide-nucleotide amidohydrolase family protein [Methylocella sp.]|nr:nicotinamide-nucleotide amidohydrolase family protein [Methylocella sp.]